MPRPSPATPRVAHRPEAWSLRGRTQVRAVGVTATTKKCLKGIACVGFTPKMRVYSLNCVTPAQRDFLPRRLHASPVFDRADTVVLSGQPGWMGRPQGPHAKPGNQRFRDRHTAGEAWPRPYDPAAVGARPCLARRRSGRHRRFVGQPGWMGRPQGPHARPANQRSRERHTAGEAWPRPYDPAAVGARPCLARQRVTAVVPTQSHRS